MERKHRIVTGGLLGLALAGLIGVTQTWASPPDPVVPPPTTCEAAVLPEPSNPNKVTLCHFTGSDGNPFVINEVSASAAASHADHHGDCQNPADGPTVCVP